MAPTQKRKADDGPLSPNTKRARKKVVNELAEKVYAIQVLDSRQECSQMDGCGSKYGSIKTIVADAKKIYPWVDRTKIYNCLKTTKRKAKAREKKDESATRVLEEECFVVVATRKPSGGRPKGSTARAKQNLKEMKKRAIDEVASCYLKEKVKNGGKVPNGSFKTVVHKVLDAFNIPGARLDINQHTILSRISRKSLQVNSRGGKSPMEEVEPVIYEFALWKQEAGQPISSGEGIALATFLIENTPLERKVQAFQASRYGKDTWSLTNSYWQGFMRRHAESLSLARGNRVAACRTEWTTYENVLEMYSLVYEQMVDAGVARNLPVEESFWTNDSGEPVETEAEASGCKVDVDIEHPEWILFGDEVGTDINQKDDGHIGGTKYCVSHGTKANIKSSTKDGRFTLIGFGQDEF